MLIIGAGGFAKELLSCISNRALKEIKFFDDVNPDRQILFDKYQVLKEDAEVKTFFEQISSDFTLGIGDPFHRKKLYDKFTNLGGNLVSVISEDAFIGNYDVKLDSGINILAGVNISNTVTIGKGTMIYYNANITHDCTLGEFVEISPGVNILGRVTIGSYTTIGSGAIILPDVNVGSNVTIGAGAVVTKDVADGLTVVGIPAKPYKT